MEVSHSYQSQLPVAIHDHAKGRNLITDNEITDLYSSLMEEAKTRIDAIGSIVKELRDNPSRSDRFLQLEFCYLQIRMICETIALCAVFVHEPLGLTGDVRKAYSAGKIFTLLSEINPRCFPVPIKVKTPSAKAKDVSIEPPSITRDRLVQIYVTCDDALHRGSLKRILKDRSLRHDIDMVESFYKDIILLLRSHAVLVASSGKFLFAKILPTKITVELANVIKNA